MISAPSQNKTLIACCSEPKHFVETYYFKHHKNVI